MYAIISSGGKQYKVEEGQTLRIEKLDGHPGDKVELEQVLLVKTDDSVKVGTPHVENARVTGTIVEAGLQRKVIVFKKKRRKQYRRWRGHRQPFSAVRIDTITH